MADKALDMSLPDLRSHNLKALVLDQSPTVLSLGRLCMDHQCDLLWDRGELPRLYIPDNEEIVLDVQDYTPHLVAPCEVRQNSCPRILVVIGCALSAPRGHNRPWHCSVQLALQGRHYYVDLAQR